MNEYDNLLNKWRENKCIASCIVHEPIKSEILVTKAVAGMLSKNASVKIIVIVDNFGTRCNIVNTFKEYNINSSNVTVLDYKYIKANINYRYDVSLFVGLTSYAEANHIAIRTKFKLFIITTDKISNEARNEIYKYFPCINQADFTKLENARMKLPVEEHHIGINFDNDVDGNTYNQYCEYITNIINIFGSFEMIGYARVGNKETGQSAEAVRLSIAQYNGWSETLDTSIPFNKTIDDIFNPIVLAEKASTAYNIIRTRIDFVNNYNGKLKVILDLLNGELKDKKVLIVNKSGKFANLVSDYLIDNGIDCGLYHDEIENAAIYDDASGDYIRYKTGKNKGEVKLFGSTMLSNNWLNKFNMSRSDALFKTMGINVLSIKNCSSDKLKCTVDAVIFTSGLNASVDEFRYRYKDINYSKVPNVFYKIYINGTIEEKSITDEKVKYKREIISNNNDKYFVQNFGD